MLTGDEIEKRVRSGEIIIDPFDPNNLGPNSYDLTLSEMLLIYNLEPPYPGRWVPGQEPYIHPGSVLDMRKEPATEEITIPDHGLVLWPGRLYLGATREHTRTDTLVPGIEGRSSVGRLGINVHITAGFGDVGFEGTWTLEISVIHPVRVYAGVRICQIYYQEPVGKIGKRYNSDKYQKQSEPKPSMLWKDFQS